MDHIIIIKATNDMQDSIYFPNIGQELVAQSFPLGCPFDEACDVQDIHCCGEGSLWVDQTGQFIKPAIRHGDYSDIRFLGGKRIIGR